MADKECRAVKLVFEDDMEKVIEALLEQWKREQK